MTYNVAQVAFYAAALHLSDPRFCLLEECIDDLARRNKYAEEQLNLLEEFAEEILDVVISRDEAYPCSRTLSDLVNENGDSLPWQALNKRRDLFIGINRQYIDEIVSEEGADDADDLEEVSELKDQIAVAEHIFDNPPQMTDNELEELVNLALSLDEISKDEPLHLYYAHEKPYPYAI